MVALWAFMVVLSRTFVQVNAAGPNPMARLLPKWVQSAFSMEAQTLTSYHGFLAIGFQHPFVLILTLALPITIATAFLTGDVERRVITLVLARPIGRFRIVTAVAAVLVFWSTLAVTSIVFGCYSGYWWSNISQPLDLERIWKAGAALYLLVLGFAAVGLAVAASFDERGDAIGWCVTLILTMYVWNFLSQVLTGTGSSALPNYSIFRLYNPTAILLRGEWNVQHLQILAGVTATGTVAALLIFRYRNI